MFILFVLLFLAGGALAFITIACAIMLYLQRETLFQLPVIGFGSVSILCFYLACLVSPLKVIIPQ